MNDEIKADLEAIKQGVMTAIDLGEDARNAAILAAEEAGVDKAKLKSALGSKLSDAQIEKVKNLLSKKGAKSEKTEEKPAEENTADEEKK